MKKKSRRRVFVARSREVFDEWVMVFRNFCEIFSIFNTFFSSYFFRFYKFYVVNMYVNLVEWEENVSEGWREEGGQKIFS